MLSLAGWKLAGAAGLVAALAIGGAVLTRQLERGWREAQAARAALAEERAEQATTALRNTEEALDGFMRLTRRADRASTEAQAEDQRIGAGADRTIRKVADEGTDDRAGPGADAARRWLRELVEGIDAASDRWDASGRLAPAPIDAPLPEAGAGADAASR